MHCKLKECAGTVGVSSCASLAVYACAELPLQSASVAEKAEAVGCVRFQQWRGAPVGDK